MRTHTNCCQGTTRHTAFTNSMASSHRRRSQPISFTCVCTVPTDLSGGSYDARRLSGWATAFASWAAQGRAVYCYFDYDERAYAAHNAERLQAML